jgi:hypothetical protein
MYYSSTTLLMAWPLPCNRLLIGSKPRYDATSRVKVSERSLMVWTLTHNSFLSSSIYLNIQQQQLFKERTGLDQDEALAWIRWMKFAPRPLIVDLSADLRFVAAILPLRMPIFSLITIADANFSLINVVEVGMPSAYISFWC